MFFPPSYKMELTLPCCTGPVMGGSRSVCHGDKAVLGPVVKDKPGISKPKDWMSQIAQGIKVWREEARVLTGVKDI